MIIFEKWWHKGNKVVCLHYYREWLKPEFKIYTNGAKRKNGDSCYDFNIHFGRFAFWYTNYDLQRVNGMNKTQVVYEQMKGQIQNLEERNKRLKEALDFYREYPRKIIVQFWMWYVSGNHKRDLSRKEEGEKYAENFLNDLVKEIGGIEE